jgi:hypothetical protein
LGFWFGFVSTFCWFVIQGGLFYFMCFVLSFKKISIFQGQLVELTSNNTPNWQNLQFCVWAIFQSPNGGLKSTSNWRNLTFRVRTIF